MYWMAVCNICSAVKRRRREHQPCTNIDRQPAESGTIAVITSGRWSECIEVTNCTEWLFAVLRKCFEDKSINLGLGDIVFGTELEN